MAAMTEPVEVVEYHPFLADQIQPDAREYRFAAIGTLAFHALLVGVLFLFPTQQPEHEPDQPLRRLTPLVDPPLTQTERNKAPRSNEIEVPSANLPAPNVKTATPRKKFEPPPPAQVVQNHNPTPALPQEPPKVMQTQPQTAQVIPPIAVPPPPKTVQ